MDNRILSPKKIFLDRDGDGIIDFVDLQLHLAPSCSHPMIFPAIMDLSASLGFEAMGMDLPTVTTWEKKDSSFRHHLYIGLSHEQGELRFKRGEDEYCLIRKDEGSLARGLREFIHL
jgi:hypothetical protein